MAGPELDSFWREPERDVPLGSDEPVEEALRLARAEADEAESAEREEEADAAEAEEAEETEEAVRAASEEESEEGAAVSVEGNGELADEVLRIFATHG